ncbi:MAG: hypothetical protein LBJ23_01095 [Tannerella sp.]|nr:hypothetical protein [Tannerella sp.]
MTQKKRQIAGCILMLVFAFHYVNISFFYHSHTINRLTILHSHLYGAGHVKNGTHSDSELSLISVLSAFHSLQAAPCTVVAGLFLFFATVLRIGSEEKPVSVLCGNSFLRAPPAMC